MIRGLHATVRAHLPPGRGQRAPFGTDRGHAFIMKGVDTITGKVNGFANIGAAMGAETTTFYGDGFLPIPTNTFTNPLGGRNPAFPEFNTIFEEGGGWWNRLG